MRVFSNLAITLDGRIADVKAPGKPLGTPYDRQMMQVIRKQCDVVLVGAGTLRAHPHTMKLIKKPAKNQKQPANAIITASGKLDSDMKFWDDPSVLRLIFTTEKGFDEAMRSSKDRALVYICGKMEVDFKKVFEILKSCNFKNVLVEGGGQIIGEVMKAKLLQELYVTLTPWILGGTQNPSLVHTPETLEQWKKLQLLKSTKKGDEIYLHYKVKGAVRV